jgi:apolipoprotein D and lipocalin family protein
MSNALALQIKSLLVTMATVMTVSVPALSQSLGHESLNRESGKLKPSFYKAGIGLKDADPVRPVEGLELDRYLGKWFDIRSIPNSFQRGCTNTSAEYNVEDGGTLEVKNTCDKVDSQGAFLKAEEAIGRAWVKNADNSILKVSFACFFGFCLESAAGDYWVLALGPIDSNGQYSWAVVGTPNREYGWVLSRSTFIEPATMTAIESAILDQGYDPNDFQMTRHTSP